MLLLYPLLALIIAGWIMHTYMARVVNTIVTVVMTVYVIGAFLLKRDSVPFEDV